MSRADAGSDDDFLEEVNVSEQVQRAVDSGLLTLADVGVPPQVVIPDDVRTLRVGVDKRRFERVMANLLENAANYGHGATIISVAASTNGSATSSASDEVEIAVEDAGPGINPLERSKVFERFYRGSASGRRGTGTGTGLGLALVAEHVRLMHGRAWVESSPSGGARFVVALPILSTPGDGSEEDGW